MDSSFCSKQLVGRCEIVGLVARSVPLGPLVIPLENGIFQNPAFPGFSANYLMWRKAVLRWKMTTDHPVEKLGAKVMNSLDWTVQAFVVAGISAEALLQSDAVESILKVLDAKAGWIQEDESKLLLRKALFSW